MGKKVGRLATALAVAAAACGNSGGAGRDGGADAYAGTISCTQVENVEAFGPLQVCEEAAASARAQLQQGCPNVVNAPCPRTNALGGCQISSGGFAESFWYAPAAGDAEASATPADIQMLCAGASGTPLTP
jgi:hypothetical protein